MNDTQTQPQATLQSIKLIEGTFTPSEAADILNDIIAKKINFHKIQRLKINEGNHDDPCNHDNERLSELQASKDRLSDILKDVRINGKRMSIKANISIEVVD